MTTPPRRSALYLPASNDRAIEKARGLACDVVILDLEDAVAPEAKALARRQAAAAVNDGGFGHRELVIRVNALSTQWGEDDLRAVMAVRPDAVLVPKVDEPDDVAAYAAILGAATPIWAMIETARAVFRLEAIATAAHMAALVMGTNDLAKELRARPGAGREPLLGVLTASVAAARIGGLTILDGVYNAIDDADGFARQCAQAVEFGFDGKTLVHPDQIALCNAAFTPGPDDIAWARAIEEAFAVPGNDTNGVIRVAGRMVERLHLEQARDVLASAAAIDARGY